MDEPISRLPGERNYAEIVVETENGASTALLLHPTEGRPVPVTFLITNYRLYAQASPATRPSVRPVNIPLMLIETTATGTDAMRGLSTLTVQTKQVWSFTFGFRDEDVFHRIVRSLSTIIKPSVLKHLPAFDIASAFRTTAAAAAAASSSSAATEAEGTVALGGDSTTARCAAASVLEYAEWEADAGWSLYDAASELQRQLVDDPAAEEPQTDITKDGGVGVDLRPWYRATALNQPETAYGTFATYPPVLIVPNSSSDDLLLRSTLFRSRCRIPAVSYVCLATGATLARSSQPLLRQSDSARFDDSTVCANLVNPYTEASAKHRPGTTTAPAATGSGGQSPPPTAGGGASPPNHGSLASSPQTANPPSLLAGGAQSFAAPPSLLGGDDGEWAIDKTAPSTTRAQSRTLFVLDLRPKAAATGNLAMGGGYESGLYYNHCRVSFAGIDNIHGVTAAWGKLRQLVQQHNGRASKGEFYEQLASTLWLVHIQRVLTAADTIANHMMSGESVLTHCTDGWDRTSQATSLSMMMVDPFYRTIRGFCLIIEKEFCSFGHKFAERSMHDVPGDTCGTAHMTAGLSDVDRQQDHGAGGAHKKQPSPIFQQWLDAVFQLIRQFPTKFEFTPFLLEFLAYHVYSCFFGTFLCNCAKERILEGVTTQTISLWTEVERLVRQERTGHRTTASRFLNPLYEPPLGHRQHEVDRLVMSTGSSRVVFWESHYLKFDTDRWNGEPTLEEAMLRAMPPPVVDPSQQMWDEAESRSTLQRDLHARLVAERDPSVQRRAVPSESMDGQPRLGTAMGGSNTSIVDSKAKRCWKCGEKFGLFRPAIPCGMCRHLHCNKCVFTIPGRKDKLCESCIAIAGASD